MNMGGITNYTAPGEAEIMSLKAGMDVLEYVTDPDMSIKTITERIRKGSISIESINEEMPESAGCKILGRTEFPKHHFN